METTRISDPSNAWYVQAIYEEWVRNPGSVDESWRRLFEADGAAGANGHGSPVPVTPVATPADGTSVQASVTSDRSAAASAARQGAAEAGQQLRTARAAGELVDAYRLHGHTSARLDPLGRTPPGHPMLRPEFHGITEEDLSTVPAEPLGLGIDGETAADVVQKLRSIYTGPIGYEYEHLQDPERREWLRDQIESGEHTRPADADTKRQLLKRLSEVEGFEGFLHRAYLGQKRFSVEGNDMLVPMLDLAIERAAEAGAREVVIGMPHRGRLNTLVNVLGIGYDTILSAFEGQQILKSGTGDVKYHLGARGTHSTPSGDVELTLAPNPSHLEFVDPVVEGMARAKQIRIDGRTLERDESRVLPVLLHGDAAFAGQGVVPETLNLAELEGYRTGGTLHIIVNNQVGFTTDPKEARSTEYSSDIARGFNLPVFHVNADEPESCLAVIRLAIAYRNRFHDDVVIDLIGYRRYGHNEGDEPAYTQPVLYEKIGKHPTVRTILAERLASDGTVSSEDAKTMADAVHQRLLDAQTAVREKTGQEKPSQPIPQQPTTLEPPLTTGVDRERLLQVDREIHAWPEDFQPSPKLTRALEKRAKQLEQGGPVDWAHGEALALGTLLAEGYPVRLTGQDAERGTFSHRHAVLHDGRTGAKYVPLRQAELAQAPFEVYNSPLTETAVVGFEYGYSTVMPKALVLWEAQFGDFANVAQIIIDQFISAGRAKWAQDSGMVMLLPHGYEGQGPEHSSARMERFLQLAAEDNLRAANCTTPAQYFHLLRRQAHLEERRPLIVFTPKSLLRHPRAVSTIADLTDASFQFIIDDAGARERAETIRRVVLCTGKVYYDLTGEGRDAAEHVAVARIEQLYPLADDRLREVLAGYAGLTEVVWAQEEPQNMGAWRFMEPRLRELLPEGVTLRYVGRPERASPAEGYHTAHEAQQRKIVEAALAPIASVSKRPARSRR